MTKQTNLSLTSSARGVERLTIEKQAAHDPEPRAELPPSSVPARDEVLRPEPAEAEPVSTSKHTARAVSPRVTDARRSHSDVFLCHNSDDKDQVQDVANALKKKGVKPWLDIDRIRPGDRIARVLEQQIRTTKVAAVFVGKSGEGPWQREEIDALLGQAARRGCRLIPVLLPGCPKEPPLPVFLKERRWVDFRVAEPDPISTLVWGIFDEEPETPEAATNPRRAWTWFSTVESVAANDVSLLAIAETVVAIVAYFLLAWWLGPLRIVISAVASLFFVLRTESSVKLSWDWYEALFPLKDREIRRSRLIHNLTDGIPMLFIGTIYLWISSIINAILMVAIRSGATARTFLWHPLECIKEIPDNWIRAITSVDVNFPLELLPEAHQRYGHRDPNWLTLLTLMPGRGIKKHWSDVRGIVEYVLLIIFTPIFGILFGLPALLYRLYIKGAFIIYCPLMFSFYMSAGRSLRDRVQNILKRDVHRGIRGFAAIAAGLLVVKSYLYFAWEDLARRWYEFPGLRKLETIVAPDSFPPWQLALCAIIINVWGLYYWADWIVDRLNNHSLEHPDRAETILRVITVIQWLLCIYVILCWIYLAVSHSNTFELPPLGTHLLPWM